MNEPLFIFVLVQRKLHCNLFILSISVFARTWVWCEPASRAGDVAGGGASHGHTGAGGWHPHDGVLDPALISHPD